MLNAYEIDKQCVHVILRDNVRSMKKAMDDIEVPNVSCVLHRLYTRVCCHSALSQTHLLTQGRWLANVAIAYAE